jgi:hypothetical protein
MHTFKTRVGGKAKVGGLWLCLAVLATSPVVAQEAGWLVVGDGSFACTDADTLNSVIQIIGDSDTDTLVHRLTSAMSFAACTYLDSTRRIASVEPNRATILKVRLRDSSLIYWIPSTAIKMRSASR